MSVSWVGTEGKDGRLQIRDVKGGGSPYTNLFFFLFVYDDKGTSFKSYREMRKVLL